MSTTQPATESLNDFLRRPIPFTACELFAVMTQLVENRTRTVARVYSRKLDAEIYLVELAEDEVEDFRGYAREVGIWVIAADTTTSTAPELQGQLPAPPITDPPGVTAIEIARSVVQLLSTPEQETLKSA